MINGKEAVARRIGQKKARGMKYLLLAIPFVIYVFAFSYVPLMGWIYSVFDYKMGQRWLDPSVMEFIGAENFIKLFRERAEVGRILRNTLVMSGLGLLGTPIPIIFAIMLNEVKNVRFRKFVQTTTTLPNFISWITRYGIALAFFSASGFVNMILKELGMETSPTGILGDGDKVWIFQWLLSVWKSFGWSAIIYIAAISGIDQELFDAAKVDGASKLQQIRYVTVPGIMSTFVVMFLLAVSNILTNGFDQYFMFYNSLVADKIEVLDYYVYKVGFIIGDYSYSITLGMLKSLISIALLFLANWISKRVRGEGIV